MEFLKEFSLKGTTEKKNDNWEGVAKVASISQHHIADQRTISFLYAFDNASAGGKKRLSPCIIAL